MALSIAQFAQVADWFDSTSPRSVTGLSWSAGDIIIVLSGIENGVGSPTVTPSNANLTFNLETSDSSPSESECRSFIHSATAGSSESGQSISLTSTGGSKNFGGAVWVITGSPTGTANAATNRTESAITFTPSADSVVIYGAFDWNTGASGKTIATGTGTATERYDNDDGASYGIYGGEWVGVTAASTAFGVTSYTGWKVTHSIIEVTNGGAGGTILTADPGTLSLGGGTALFSEAQAAAPGTLSLVGGTALAVVSALAEPGSMLLEGGDAELLSGVFVADPGTLSLTGFVAFDVSVLCASGGLSLGGGSVLLSVQERFLADSGNLLLGGGVISFNWGTVASPGSLVLDGSDILISADVTLDAEAGSLVLVGQASSVDLALEGLPGTLSFSGSAVFQSNFSAEIGSLTLVGASATLSSTAEAAIAADPGSLTLVGAEAGLVPSLLSAGGVLSLGGGTALFLQGLLSTPGQLSIIGGDAVFNTDVVLVGLPGNLLLSGSALFGETVLLGPGTLTLGGGAASLIATQVNSVVAASGTLLLGGGSVAFLITGLTWEGDDQTWGGTSQAFGLAKPVFVIGRKFYQSDSKDQFALGNIEVLLERVGITVVGVDREGRPRSDPATVKLLTEVWPVFRGVPGTVIDIYAGSQDRPSDGVRWEGPFQFVLGQDLSVQPIVEGVYLGVRFYSLGQPSWTLISYDLDITPLGRIPTQ